MSENIAKPKIAFLVIFTEESLALPLEETAFFCKTIPSIINQANILPNYQHILYLGIGDTDAIALDKAALAVLHAKMAMACQGTSLSIIFGIGSRAPETPTHFWNELVRAAFDNGSEYFLTLSDNQALPAGAWLPTYINVLESNPFFPGLGIVLPAEISPEECANIFFNRTHIDIYGSLFPPPLALPVARKWLFEAYKLLGAAHLIPSSAHAPKLTPNTAPVISMNDPFTFLVFDFLMSRSKVHTKNWMDSMAKTPIGNVAIPESKTPYSLQLITQYYHVDDAARQVEIDACLKKNYTNPLIDRIHLLTERAYDLKPLLGELSPARVIQTVIAKRLTFAEAFRYANANLAGNVAIVSNADIFFDDSIALLKRLDLGNKALALTRHELLPDGATVLYNFIGPCGNPAIGSQDAWVFSVPLPDMACDIELGVQGCDGRIASILYENGVDVLNPCKTIRAIHNHASAFRTYDRRKVLDGAPLYVNHCTLNPVPHDKFLATKLGSISCIATIATYDAYQDIRTLLYSVSLTSPNIPIFLLADQKLKNMLLQEFPTLRLNIETGLDPYSGKNRSQMEKEGIWCEFMLQKCNCIEHALRHYADTLYVDSDVVFLDTLPLLDKNQDLYLSPHDIRAADEERFGRFNGGFIWISNQEFVPWWKSATAKDPKFFEQFVLNHASSTFKVSTFASNHNFGWWRLFQCDRPLMRAHQFSLDVYGKIRYQNKVLQSIHTHFNVSEPTISRFNGFILKLMGEARDPNTKKLLEFITQVAA